MIIIGAGLSGLAMGIKLKAAGIAYTIIEKNPKIGGTWWENTYPGVGVDTPSHLYTFSFAPSTHWNRYFGPGWPSRSRSIRTGRTPTGLSTKSTSVTASS
ncbi:NAD(P)-binding protein [Mycobacterium sp.]|uniref:NAD(P)-binding protein n=1 Tax=Mycobacterium sp. TaxID=1785 RepID=UPI0025E266DC|nr:NAD(P)-binding protein [Mycobacterium sp.]